MRRIIAIALIALAPVLATTPAGARSDAESFIAEPATAIETDLVSPPRIDGLDGVAAFTEYSGDPLQLIVWPNDTRRYSIGRGPDRRLRLYLGRTRPRVSTGSVQPHLLNSEVVPFYEGLSGGVYAPSFISRTTLTIDSRQLLR